MTIAQKLFSFEGRLRRRDYWLTSLLLGVIILVIYVVAFALGMDSASSGDGLILRAVTTLLFLWPSLAIGIKRCHDRNQSGWWILISFIPLIGSFWALINLGILDGTQGPNRYGKSPKGVGGDTDQKLAEVFA